MGRVMPFYEFKNTNTDEIETHRVVYEELDNFLIENPELERVFSVPQFVSGTGSAMKKAGSGWNDLMGQIKKGSGDGDSIKTK